MIHRRSLLDQAAAVRSGEVTAVDLAAHHLHRSIAAQPVFNAYVTIDQAGALAAAEAIDHRIAAGEDPGPLAGVPLALKDLIDQAGLTTTAGSGFYRSVPTRAATVVDRLESAGAVIVGRAGLHEFAFGFSSENHWFGPIRNPWDPDTSPGGSSGGSAVAAAAALAAAAIGTDTGGSIRVPAALCGLVGLKVTHGRVPLTGVFPLAPSLDTVGPLTRTVPDAAVLYRVLAGPDESDPWSWPRPVAPSEDAWQGLTVGVPEPWVEQAPASEAVRTDFSAALDRMSDLGITVEPIRSSYLEQPFLIADLIGGEVAALHRQWFQDPDKPYGPEVAERIAAALEVTLDRYVAAQRWRAGLRAATARLFEQVDLLATPTVAAGPKRLSRATIDVDGREVPYRAALSWFSALVNHMGVPALALPLAGTGPPPASLQLIAPWWEEGRLLAVGSGLEQAGVVGFVSPPGLSLPT